MEDTIDCTAAEMRKDVSFLLSNQNSLLVYSKDSLTTLQNDHREKNLSICEVIKKNMHSNNVFFITMHYFRYSYMYPTKSKSETCIQLFRYFSESSNGEQSIKIQFLVSNKFTYTWYRPLNSMVYTLQEFVNHYDIEDLRIIKNEEFVSQLLKIPNPHYLLTKMKLDHVLKIEIQMLFTSLTHFHSANNGKLVARLPEVVWDLIFSYLFWEKKARLKS